MNLSDPVAVLEIGTTNTVVAIGEPLGGGRIKVAAISSIASAGVRKSQIIDVSQARFSVESVLKHLADQFDYSIGQAYLAVSGPQIRTKHVVAQVPVNGGMVHDEDIAEVNERSYDTGLPQDCYPIEISNICYKLDDIDAIISPKNMSGRFLSQRSLCIYGSSLRIADAFTVARGAKLEIPEGAVAFAGSCAAAAVLTAQNKKDGALTIDLGGGSTSFTVWVNGKLVQAGVLGVGGDHVTNDIHEAFNVSRSQAEKLKMESSAVISQDDASQRLVVPDPMPGFKPSTISRRALNTVVNARLQELFTIIRAKVDEEGRLHQLNAGVFLTGGGSALRGAVELATSVFGCGVRVGALLPEIEGLESHPHPAACAVAAGLLLIAQHQSEPSTSFFESIRKIFGHRK